MSGSFSSSVTAPSAADCSPSVRAAAGSELVGKGDMCRPASRESSSVSTRSTSAASRASGRSGRLRRAMRPVPTPWPVSSPPAPATMPCASSSTPCCRSTRPPDGRSSGSSRTEAVNSRAVSMRRVTISGSDTPAPSRTTPGRTASSTILHQHWRVAFRRRYFTTPQQLDASLQRFLDFYNNERPHQGYRTRGHTPSTLFWGAAEKPPTTEV